MILNLIVPHCIFLFIFIVSSIQIHAKPAPISNGRVFGLQLSNPKAPEVPIISKYIPGEPLQSLSQLAKKPIQKKKELKEMNQRRKETVDAAIRDVPDDFVPLLERQVEPIFSPSAGDFEMQCPNGFELVNRKCTLTVYREPLKSCPYGFYQNIHGGCEQTDSIPPQMVCPALFNPFLRGCIRRTREPPALSCLPGYFQHDETCLHKSHIQAKAECPLGYRLTPHAHNQRSVECRRHVSVVPSIDCPKGFTPLTRDRLSKLHVAVPSSINLPSHPVNLKSNAPLCIREVEKQPSFDCPKGYILDEAPKDTSIKETTETKTTVTTRIGSSTTTFKAMSPETRASSTTSLENHKTTLKKDRKKTSIERLNSRVIENGDDSKSSDGSAGVSNDYDLNKRKSGREVRTEKDCNSETQQGKTQQMQCLDKPIKTIEPTTEQTQEPKEMIASFVNSSTPTMIETAARKDLAPVHPLKHIEPEKPNDTKSIGHVHREALNFTSWLADMAVEGTTATPSWSLEVTTTKGKKKRINPSDFKNFIESVNENIITTKSTNQNIKSPIRFTTMARDPYYRTTSTSTTRLTESLRKQGRRRTRDKMTGSAKDPWTITEKSNPIAAHLMKKQSEDIFYPDGAALRNPMKNGKKSEQNSIVFRRHLSANSSNFREGKEDNKIKKVEAESRSIKPNVTVGKARCVRYVMLTPLDDLDENQSSIEVTSAKLLTRQLLDSSGPLNYNDPARVDVTKDLRNLPTWSRMAVKPVGLHLPLWDSLAKKSNKEMLRRSEHKNGDDDDDDNDSKITRTTEGFIELEVLEIPSSPSLEVCRSRRQSKHGDNDKNINETLEKTVLKDEDYNICNARETPAIESLKVLLVCPEGYEIGCQGIQRILDEATNGTKIRKTKDEMSIPLRKEAHQLTEDVCEEKACRKIEVQDGSWKCPPDLELCHDGDLAIDTTCEGIEKLPAKFKCPIESQNPTQSGSCEVLLSQPLETKCPEGFSVASKESRGRRLKSASSIDWGPPPGVHVIPGLCQRVEYAEHQTLCPVGYSHAAQKGLKSCTATKTVSPAYICEPGFFEVEDPEKGILCAKTLEAAPTLVSIGSGSFVRHPMEGIASGDISVCQYTEERKLSCAQQKRFYGDVTDKGLKWGNKFKEKVNRKSNGLKKNYQQKD